MWKEKGRRTEDYFRRCFSFEFNGRMMEGERDREKVRARETGRACLLIEQPKCSCHVLL
jgi:hypothetical protein